MLKRTIRRIAKRQASPERCTFFRCWSYHSVEGSRRGLVHDKTPRIRRMLALESIFVGLSRVFWDLQLLDGGCIAGRLVSALCGQRHNFRHVSLSSSLFLLHSKPWPSGCV